MGMMPRVLATVLLVYLLGETHAAKSASSFSPTQQTVHMGVSLTVRGTELSTADVVVLALHPSAGGNGCGSSTQPPQSAGGMGAQNFVDVSSDGTSAYFTVTPSAVVNSSLCCVKMFPSGTWTRVGTETFSVVGPVISSTTTSFGTTGNAYDVLAFTLSGTGLVRSVLRLAFKASALACGGTSSTSDLAGGDAVGLNFANAAGTSGGFEFSLQLSNSLVGTLRICVSSNRGVYTEVSSLTGLSINARSAISFTPSNINIDPSIPYTFTITGQNFASSGSSALSVKASSCECSGDSTASDVIRGDELTATFVSASSNTVMFDLGPIADSVTKISISSAGTDYIPGGIAAMGGGGNSFSGTFSVGLRGEIDVVYISSPGKDFSTAPAFVPVYASAVGCGTAVSISCLMTQSVTRIVQLGGKTRGCAVGTVITGAAGAGGIGFEAVVAAADDLGEIQLITITNHGAGYTKAPQLLMANSPSCRCGSYIVDREPTFDSFAAVDIAGGFDPCFITTVALNGALEGNGGWNTRTIRLCARFGSTSMWSQISAATVRVQLPLTGTFTPSAVDSGQLFELQMTGTGYELDGPAQSRIKIAYDCDLYQGSDVQGALPEGVGRPCDSLSVSGGLQTCHIKFKLVIPGTVVQAQICRRFGGDLYALASNSLLNINGFRMLSITPSLTVSNAPYIVTLRGVNFDTSLVDPTFTGVLRAKICPDYVCKGNHPDSNNAEPCAGTDDQRMCFADASCEAETVCRLDVNGSAGVFPGGSKATILRVQNCNAENYACTEAVFEWTLMSMRNVNGQIYWMYDFLEYATFQLVPNSQFLVEGSWLTKFEQTPPSPIYSGSPLFLNISGRNLVNGGPGVTKFKWVNTTRCEAATMPDDEWTFVGGDGRNLDSFSGNLVHADGLVKFVISFPFRTSPLIADYKWREVEVYDVASLDATLRGNTGFRLTYYGHTTNVYGTWVDGMSPTDHNFTISTKVALGKMPLPFFDSGSTYKVTIWGARFGDSAEDSSLTMRPIAMPFALDASAIACVETDTIPTNRPKTCKEFKYTSDDYDGGASAYCSGGSEIDSAHIEDYYPTSISKYIEVREGITTIKSFAVFEFSKVLLEHSARFMVCWRMSRKDHYHFPWATIGHIDARTRNMGINGIIAWDVWVTHTFGMYGAYIISVEPQPEIIANRPFKLTMVGRGVGCDPLNPKYRVKLAIGNGIQALVGGTVGGGCDSGSSSESVGSVIGGDAVIPTCRQDLTNGNEVVVETEFTVMVEAVTKLELCWSSTAGNPFFKNAFYVGGAVFVTLEAKPWYVRQFLINNQPIETAAKLMAHQPFSLTILGEGLQKTGAVNLQVSLAVDCLDSDTVVPGGDWRTVDCIFSHQSATVEFNIFSPVKGVQICLQRSTQKLIWTPFLERSRYYCTPEYCGAPRCAPATNYLFDDFGCDEVCCEKACLNDPYCNYWQRYDIPGRVFRRCQTMAHCKNPSLLMLFDRSPIISQKTFGTGRETYAAGTIPDVLGPVVFDVTPQVNPPLRARVPFVVKVQGTGLVPAHVQIHVKVANTQIGCNDMKALNKTMAAWNEIALEREAVFSQLEAAKNFSYNGTCGGGNSNCEGGPAPPGTTCFFDVNCQSPAAPGGKCIPPNTGTSCLKDEHCTFNGFCNNSLYNLSMTPPPEPPPMQIPFQEVSDAGTLLGGTGRFLKVDNFSYGVTTFQIDEAGKGVLCYAIRNPQEEQNLVSENGQFIKDLSLIQAMSSYIETREFEILMPQILTVTPDHTFLFVDTVYVIGGVGLYIKDKIKLAHPSIGCCMKGLSAFQQDRFGAVEGGAGVQFESVNSVGTLGKVRIKISEPLKLMIDENQLLICYQMYSHEGQVQEYLQIGNLFVANSPPIVTSFLPAEIFYTEPTHIVLEGMALGAAQKIKLIDADRKCSGDTMNDQIQDDYGLAPGSFSSFLTMKDPGDYYEIFQDPYTNHAYLMQTEGVLNIISDSQEEKLFTLCLKYGDLSLSGGTPGFLTVGNITAKPLKIQGLSSIHIYSGQRASFLMVGSGLLGQVEMKCKLVQKYHACTGVSKTAGIIAGGSACTLLSYPNRSSTKIFGEVMIPAGIQTEASVCVKFGTGNWRSIGALAVKRPPITNGQIFHVSSSTALGELVAGEPFYVRIQLLLSAPLTSLDMIKVVLSTATCGGTNELADAVMGGGGTNINASGIASFYRGIDSGGQKVKLCSWAYGSSGYKEDGSAQWAVNPPSVTSFSPLSTSVNVSTTFALTGRGLATVSVNTIMYISYGSACAVSGDKYQLVSNDGMGGQSASLLGAFWTSGQYTVCLERGSSLIYVTRLTVTDLPSIQAVTPTLVYRNNNTAFLLKGSGLTATIQIKIVPLGDLCSGNTSLTGANWSSIAPGGVFLGGTRAMTVGFIITSTASGKLCFAVDEQFSYIIDAAISITVREWTTPILFSPQTDKKTDIQRVEANMTDVVPACTANWKSKWMLRGPGDGVERDTPAIVDWRTEFKCYERQEDLPIGVPSGYAPPGIDKRLVSAVRDMPIEFSIAGGVGVGDTIFISKGKCGDNLTHPLEDPTLDYVPGGQPVVVTQSMIIDVTGLRCQGVRKDAAVLPSSVGTTLALTGANQRQYGVKLSFKLTEISQVGQFHKLCVVPAGVATAMSVEDIDIKVRPPMLLAMEPPLVYSGMQMPYVLRGLGLSPEDKIKIMDGETFAACEIEGDESDVRGGRSVTLGAQTTSTSSRVDFTFEIPSKHARVCYKYRGSDVWGEMTNALSLRTSGYLYGYHDTMHFYFGETIVEQTGDNMVFGRNQTILVLGPVPEFLIGEEFVARQKFSLTVEGNGLTEKARYIIVPIRVGCGGMPAGRRNLMQDGTVYSSVRLRTVIGGESRPPTVFSNDPVDSFEKMSQCTGSNIRDGCFAARATARNSIDYPVGVSIKNLGRCRVCYLYDFAAEYQEVGQIQILPPRVFTIYPRQVMINIPFSITVKGRSLRSTDRMKIVDGISCNAPISSRPYTMPVTVTDSPEMSTATTDFTVAGKGAYTDGKRKICYSYDKGVTYQDSGFTMTVTSPQLQRVFPTTLAVAGERRIWFFGQVISPGDRVKIIHSSRRCEGLDNWESTVYGGEGRALDLMTTEGQVLPDPIGESQWPTPWPNASSVFTLVRTDEAVFCYLHRDGAGWEDVRGPDGQRIILTIRDTSDLALGRTGPEWGNGAGAGKYDGAENGVYVAVLSSVVSFFITFDTGVS